MHLDIEVPDLESAVKFATEAGATQAEHQPQDTVRVMLDPDGHPFCLYVDTTV
jgi:Glyoxalase-like domain